MTTDEALKFLRDHQPLPPTSQISDDVLRQFDEVRKHFVDHRDDRSVPLLLNSFGDGDGHGVYQLVEDTIRTYPKSVVVPALLDALQKPSGSVRYWCAQFAANYACPEFVKPLGDLLALGNLDERIAAVMALEAIGTSEARQVLRMALHSQVECEVRLAIQEALRPS